MSVLYPEQLKQSLLNDFEEAMELRESADYGLTFSEDGAARVIESAKTFYTFAKKLIQSTNSSQH